MWADLADLVLVTGPVLAVGLRRGAVRVVDMVRARAVSGQIALLGLALAATVAVAVADESGLSRGETERIWLPFAVWLVALAGLIPAGQRRWWLIGQVVVTLVVKHLPRTQW